jgi:hypothetical protein
MTVKCIQKKCNVINAISRLDKLKSDTNQYQQEQKRQQRKRAKQRAQEEEQWTLDTATTTKASLEEDSTYTKLSNELSYLVKIHTLGIQEIISRIQHASTPLFLEISRGFFVPFCTVALSSLARVRSMIIDIGKISLTHIQQLQLELLGEDKSKTQARPWLSTSDYEKYMNELIDHANDDELMNTSRMNSDGIVLLDQTEILGTLGLTPAAKNRRQKISDNQNPVEKTTTVSITMRDDNYNNSMMLLEKSEEILYTKNNIDEHDIGESVTAVNTIGVPKMDGTATAQYDTKKKAKPADSSSLEKNMSFVASFQNKKKNKNKKMSKKGCSEDDEDSSEDHHHHHHHQQQHQQQQENKVSSKKKNKRKQSELTTTSSGEEELKMKSSKNKEGKKRKKNKSDANNKKKKKEKGNNFFDELFDS